MKIVKLTAENYKRLKVVEITPEGHLVQITGANGAGKSSVLDAIESALGGGKRLPAKPIRKGETSARITLDLGEIIVTRRFTEKGSDLVVEAASGARFPSPQRMLDDLISSISFDPLAFARADEKAQYDMLRQVVKLDIDLDALAGQNRSDYEARTEVNRQAKQIRAQAAGISVPDGLPAEAIDVDELVGALEDAGRVNADIERLKKERAQEQGRVQALYSHVERIRQEAEGHLRRAQDLRRQADEAEAASQESAALATLREAEAAGAGRALESAPPIPEPVDTATVRQRIDDAGKINAGIAQRIRRTDLEQQAASLEEKADILTQNIESRNKAKNDAITAANMPIPDIGFGDGMVLYKGLPFDQASDAERLRASAAIAMAGNPKLRVLRIKEGSLLDRNGLRLLREMAEASDYQIWLEAVDESGTVGVVMEDGSVKKATTPVPETKVEQEADGGRLV